MADKEISDVISRRKSLAAISRCFESALGCTKKEYRDLLIESFRVLPPAEISIGDIKMDNEIHLCNSCKHEFPICPASYNDMAFGNSVGGDNICMCRKYLPIVVRT